jgi:hypothetical protein
MVKLTKRPLPDGVTIDSENDYRKGIVLKTLIEDCHSKCYICEDKPTNINVEHIIPHRNDISLKHSWDNLFIACGHCNSIKSVKYDDIINPIEIDPEDSIGLSIGISNDFRKYVEVTAMDQNDSTLRTTELLKYVYNGGSTPIK